MKKCTCYLDALDHHESEDSARWQDILIHASKCPDCSLDMNIRAEMLEKLAETLEPNCPNYLHDEIMTAISSQGALSDRDDATGLLERLFERLLQPFEILAPVACMLMFIFLVQLNDEPVSKGAIGLVSHSQHKSTKMKIAQLPPPEVGSLEHVSGEEVKAFLARLEEFRRENPEEPAPVSSYMPGVRLVGENNLWRQP